MKKNEITIDAVRPTISLWLEHFQKGDINKEDCTKVLAKYIVDLVEAIEIKENQNE